MNRTQPAPPVLTTHRIAVRDGSEETITAQLLGHGSSDDGERDRWFEVDIFLDERGEFIVHTRGMTAVPGEKTLVRTARTQSAYEIIELLTVHRNRKTYLPRQSARAIAQAAQWNENIRDAYVNRAVI